MTAQDSPIYRDLMRFKPDGWTANAWAVNAGVSRTVWTDMRRHGNPSRRTLEKLLAAAGSSLAEFEALRVGDTPMLAESGGALADPATRGWRPAPSPALPLVATAAAEPVELGGPRIDATEIRFGNIVERPPRPLALAGDPDAYAITMVSDSMWPRFRPGRRLAVSPKADISVGDDVIVTISSNPVTGLTVALIGELVVRGARYFELRQFNPDTSYAIPTNDVLAVHKIIGELI